MKRVILSLLLLVPTTNMFAEKHKEKKPQSTLSVVAKTTIGLAFLGFAYVAGNNAYEASKKHIITGSTLQAKGERVGAKVLAGVASIWDSVSGDNESEEVFINKWLRAADKFKPVLGWGSASFVSAVLGLTYLISATK